eukprot:COSAG04_NODE_2609_length_3859_cov_13.516223_7_plen_222_part_01
MGQVSYLLVASKFLNRKTPYPRAARFRVGRLSFLCIARFRFGRLSFLCIARILGRRGPRPGRAWGQTAPDRPLAVPGRPRPTIRPLTCQPAGRTPSAATRSPAAGARPCPPHPLPTPATLGAVCVWVWRPLVAEATKSQSLARPRIEALELQLARGRATVTLGAGEAARAGKHLFARLHPVHAPPAPLEPDDICNLSEPREPTDAPVPVLELACHLVPRVFS